MDKDKVYYDSETGKFFIGPYLKELENKVNAILTKELHDNGYLTKAKMGEILANSIKDEEVREEYLENWGKPWTYQYGLVDDNSILVLSQSPITVNWKWEGD